MQGQTILLQPKSHNARQMAADERPAFSTNDKKGSPLTLWNTNHMIVKPFWKLATWWGMRRLTRNLQQGVHAYSDTLTHFETSDPLVALTIDDGLSREGPAASMTQEVLQLLKKYDATATFFVCTDYLKDQRDDVASLLQDGHELGNHMQADRAFYYHRLEKDEFRKQLQAANKVLTELEHLDESQAPPKHRWFRAPQGILTTDMKSVLEEENMKHVLGDCYCDDWKFAQDMDGVQDNDKCRAVMKAVAEIMLSQAQTGSIAIFHMPEKGFRQAVVYALESFLQGMQAKGWKCRSLSDMQRECAEHETE